MSDLVETLRNWAELGELHRSDEHLVTDAADEIERLRERIEELEDASVKEVLDFGVEQLSRGHDKYHIITSDQIRAAWKIYESLAIVEAHGLRVVIESIFKELNIERCEECGGSGYDDPDFHDDLGRCPACHGEGWVIGGEDE